MNSHRIREIVRRPLGPVAGLLLVGAAALAVAGCGSSSSPSSSGGGGGTPAPAVFKVGLAEQFRNLDPDTALQNDELEIINLIGGTLTQFSGPGAGSVVPGLASSWTITAGGTVYTFKLRPGLKFSDGTPLVAADVAASFKRYLTDKNNANIGLFSSIKTVTAPNPTTAVFTLKDPSGSFLTLLAEPNFIISPAAGLADPKTFYLKPISAGEYMISKFTPSQTTLVRNPNYFGPKRAIPQLQFIYVKDTNTRIIQVRSGQLDLAQNIPVDTASQLTGNSTAIYTPLFGAFYFYTNIRSGALANVNVRQAISLAIDRSQLNTLVWGGKATPLYSFYPSIMTPWHMDTVATGPNITKAKSLLVGTPCASGCTLNLIVRSDASYYQDMASIVQQNLEQIGIKLHLQSVDAATAGTDEYDGKFQLAIGGLTDYADVPDGFLVYGLQSNGGIYGLFSGYDSKPMDSLIKTAVENVGAKRLAAMTAINNLYGKDLPSIPLINWVNVSGQTSDTVHWAQPTPSAFLYVAPAPSGSG
jgi:ABC-type transport system substrate-binding protein